MMTTADGPTSIVELLYCTSLVALVGTEEQPSFSNRHLKIINTKRQSTICELAFPTSICAVKMNRRRLVVVLEEQIFVYDISNMKLLHTTKTNTNLQAICALSPSSDNCYIAYPSGDQTPHSSFPNGDVEIFDTLSLQLVNIVQAHKSPVSTIVMNSDGTLMATASEKGTVIRVFSIPDASKVYQFRRGSYPAKIYSMSFNLASSLLCVSSDTETVHIFKLALGVVPAIDGNGDFTTLAVREGEPGNRGRSGSVGQLLRRSSFHIGRNIAGSVGSYLPDMLTELWEPARDFSSLKLPSGGVQSLIALSSTHPQVMVITSEGIFYEYGIDLENGGECTLLNQNVLLASVNEMSSTLGG